jgi:hypothetical protein
MYVVEGGHVRTPDLNPSATRDRLAWVTEARMAAASSREQARASVHPEFVLTLPHQLQKDTG